MDSYVKLSQQEKDRPTVLFTRNLNLQQTPRNPYGVVYKKKPQTSTDPDSANFIVPHHNLGKQTQPRGLASCHYPQVEPHLPTQVGALPLFMGSWQVRFFN